MSQFARPISDVSKTNCITTTSGDVYTTIDEAVCDDSDYTQAYNADGNFTVALSPLLDPVVHTGHVLRVRHRCPTRVNGNPYGTPSVFRLYQGETQIAQWTATLAYPQITETFALTQEQAAAITDYGALRFYAWLDYTVVFEYHVGSRVYWVELEVPDAPAIGLEVGMVA